MKSHVSWIVKIGIKDGKLSDFNSFMTDMIKETKNNELETQSYEWYFNEEQTECHIYEKYTDSAAAMIHLNSFGDNFAERFTALVDPIGVTIYGDASSSVKEALSGFSPNSFSHVAGFTR
jgi:quinol monooxygenase YgiN